MGLTDGRVSRLAFATSTVVGRVLTSMVSAGLPQVQWLCYLLDQGVCSVAMGVGTADHAQDDSNGDALKATRAMLADHRRRVFARWAPSSMSPGDTLFRILDGAVRVGGADDALVRTEVAAGIASNYL